MNSKAQEALTLLRDDNLIWSEDFDQIRHQVADIIEETNTVTHPTVISSIRKLCESLTSLEVLEIPNA
jgi:hypothetical protein